MAANILMTGVSSFTGCHIARALVEAGHNVTATLTQSPKDYSELVKARLNYSKVKNFVKNTKFGDENILKLIKENKFDYFINHGADIKNYRSKDFDSTHSVNSAINNLTSVLKSLKDQGIKKIIHSSSILEYYPSPYGIAKALVLNKFWYECAAYGIPLTRIVIPNPIGVFENEDRLIPTFVREWKLNKTPILRPANTVLDNIPVEWLAEYYVSEINDKGSKFIYPSGFQVSNRVLIKTLHSYCDKKHTYRCINSDDPKSYVSSHPDPYPKIEQETDAFWKNYVEYLWR